MRPSNRTLILDAAATVVEREGVTSVTLDSVAVEAGLTRGGLMYHFKSRDALLQAVHEHLAQRWDAQMAAAAGTDPGEASARHRLIAYVEVATQSASRAELLFMLEGANTAEYVAPWNAVLDRWAPPLPETDHDPAALVAAIVRLAADGLWMHESLTGTRVSPELRRLIVDHLTVMTEESHPD